MNKAELLFHISRQGGMEFVFTRGNALCYPTHTHVSVYTVTAVRQGVVRLSRKTASDVYPAGAVYVVAPGEPHSPAYSDNFDIVSLCVDKNHVRIMSPAALAAMCLGYASGLVERRLLDAATLRRLLDGVAEASRMEAAREAVPDALLSALAGLGLDEPEPPRLSRFHFIRKFKRETGLTPHQYAIQNRVRRAKELIRGKVPRALAAAEAGFFDQSHLNRYFKRNLGVTPLAYRDACFPLDG